MPRKSTGDLQEELMQASNIDAYLHSNKKLFLNQGISSVLLDLYERKNFTKATLAKRAGMSEVYLHQIFSGRRNPSRDRLLCLCIGLDISLDEVQEILKQASYAQLYPRSRRDAIIAYGIMHRETLSEINDKLFAKNEKALS